MNRAETFGGIDAESIGSHLRTHCAAGAADRRHWQEPQLG
jgi:hypothetical protein